jgi:hypothetical protein
LPVLVSATVAAYLNWLRTTYYYMFSEQIIWYPVPAVPALIGIMALVLRRSFKRTFTDKELSSQPTI